MSSNEAVKVIIRGRPMSTKEINENRSNIINISLENKSISITNPNDPNREPKTFSFDEVYDELSQQKKIYDDVGYSLVESVLTGFNGTIFAYGQTGCGKTFTMVGKPESKELRGIIPNSFVHIFDAILTAPKDEEYLVSASFLEIYNEEIRDLLNITSQRRLELKEDPKSGVFVKDLSREIVKSVDEMEAIMRRGNVHRTTGATLMNEESSRSHSIFTIVIECNEKDSEGKDHFRIGKLNLVDLVIFSK